MNEDGSMTSADDDKGVDFFEKLGRGLRKGIEKGKNLGKRGMLRLEMDRAKQEVDECYAEIGKYVVEKIRESWSTLDFNDSGLTELLDQLKEVENRVKDIDEKDSNLSQG